MNSKTLVALTLCTLASSAIAVQEDSGAQTLPIVKASVSTAGPYGENWYLTLTPEGQVSLQVFYSSRPSGNLLANFNLGEETVVAIKDALEANDFFALPSQAEPAQVAMHRPNLTIEVYLGAEHHTATLYDPEALESDPTTARFLAVWEAIFEGLPFQPSW